MAFVRLTNDQAIGILNSIISSKYNFCQFKKKKKILLIKDHQIEYGVKIRFIIILFGPAKPNIDYREIGRCMGALMNNEVY